MNSKKHSLLIAVAIFGYLHSQCVGNDFKLADCVKASNTIGFRLAKVNGSYTLTGIVIKRLDPTIGKLLLGHGSSLSTLQIDDMESVDLPRLSQLLTHCPIRQLSIHTRSGNLSLGEIIETILVSPGVESLELEGFSKLEKREDSTWRPRILQELRLSRVTPIQAMDILRYCKPKRLSINFSFRPGETSGDIIDFADQRQLESLSLSYPMSSKRIEVLSLSSIIGSTKVKRLSLKNCGLKIDSNETGRSIEKISIFHCHLIDGTLAKLANITRASHLLVGHCAAPTIQLKERRLDFPKSLKTLTLICPTVQLVESTSRSDSLLEILLDNSLFDKSCSIPQQAPKETEKILRLILEADNSFRNRITSFSVVGSNDQTTFYRDSIDVLRRCENLDIVSVRGIDLPQSLMNELLTKCSQVRLLDSGNAGQHSRKNLVFTSRLILIETDNLLLLRRIRSQVNAKDTQVILYGVELADQRMKNLVPSSVVDLVIKECVVKGTVLSTLCLEHPRLQRMSITLSAEHDSQSDLVDELLATCVDEIEFDYQSPFGWLEEAPSCQKTQTTAADDDSR